MSADRIFGLVRRVLRRTMTTGTPSVQVQVESLADEIHSDVEVSESYGWTAAPPEDVPEGLAVFVGGESDHGVVLAWLDKVHRPKGLEPGEVQFYSKFEQSIKFDKLGQVLITDQAGSTIQMLANGDIVNTPASGVMRINGKLHVTDDITSDKTIRGFIDVIVGLISLKGHRHKDVEPGSGNTGDAI